MMRRPLIRQDHQRGFTLVEAIIVIVITGILAGIVGVFLRLPVQNYVDSANRAELSDIADTTMRRLSREVRLALPNSIRVNLNSTAVEFLLTKAGGRYLSAEDTNASSRPILDFVNANLTFGVVGAMPEAPMSIVPGDMIVVYNLGPGFGDADAYTMGNVARVNSVDTANRTVTMVSNPFATASISLSSPGKRFQVVNTPVMYVCDLSARTLTRFSGYVINATMTVPPSGSGVVSALLATNVSSCAFNYAALANTHSALLGVTIGLQRATNNEAVTLSNQVHVDNVP